MELFKSGLSKYSADPVVQQQLRVEILDTIHDQNIHAGLLMALEKLPNANDQANRHLRNEKGNSMKNASDNKVPANERVGEQLKESTSRCPVCGSTAYREEKAEEIVDGTYSYVTFTATDYHEEYSEKQCLRCGARYERIILHSWTEETVC